MDFTILKKTDYFFEVINSFGLNDLGGNNFTQIILDDIIRTNKLENTNTLWKQAQQIKEKLTYLDNYEIKSINYCLTKYKFENLAQKLIRKIEEATKDINNINTIILVGGSSRIPVLQDTIKKKFKTCWIYPNLEFVVAEGAGLYAGIIENKYTINEDIFLMDVLPLSLGVELVDGTFSIIIPKNTPLPIKKSQKYTTDSPSENSVKIKVYQGERKIANKNFLIGEFIFDKVSLGGVPIIEISFKVDLNSIITVIINDRKSGFEKNIIIKDIPKIDENEIEKIIEQSIKFNDIDDEELAKSQNIYLIKTLLSIN
jgi:molecular chaperone DnaK